MLLIEGDRPEPDDDDYLFRDRWKMEQRAAFVIAVAGALGFSTWIFGDSEALMLGSTAVYFFGVGRFGVINRARKKETEAITETIEAVEKLREDAMKTWDREALEDFERWRKSIEEDLE